MLVAGLQNVPGGVSTVQVILITLAGGGLVSALVALFKLKPDSNSAAVTQSQGAMETMAVLNQQLEDERNEWRTRALDAEKELAQLRLQIAQGGP